MNTSSNTIELGDICFEVIRKDIKNVHLSVHPPLGRVTVSAPTSMDLETIRLFSISKLGWIRKHQSKLIGQKREPPREYVTRESHYYLGKRYLLKVVEEKTARRVVIKHNTIELHVRRGVTKDQKESLLQAWYREQLRVFASKFIGKTEKKMKVRVEQLAVRAMRTKWGACNPKSKRIVLNTELAKKSVECIEYILTHEMVHLLERNHNDTFIGYMNEFFPKWKHTKEELNRTALGYVEWEY